MILEIDCYEVREIGGGGQSEKTVALFKEEKDAMLLAGTFGGYGRYHRKQMSIKVFENMTEYLDDRKAALRAQALAKLSTAEREALGV